MVLDNKQRNVIEELYREMYYQLCAYAISVLNNRSLAEEAVQDTFRIACAKSDDILSSPNPKGWLLNTLKYAIQNVNRSRARINSMIVSSFDLVENTVAEDTDTLSIDILYSDIIDTAEYELLKNIALEKYTMLEVAQELGISVEACKKRVQRAKKKLKKLLKQKK